MGGFYAKQPNGRFCRFSTTTDCLTDINIPDVPHDYENSLRDFDEIVTHFQRNMPRAVQRHLLYVMGYTGKEAKPLKNLTGKENFGVDDWSVLDKIPKDENGFPLDVRFASFLNKFKEKIHGKVRWSINFYYGFTTFVQLYDDNGPFMLLHRDFFMDWKKGNKK